MPSRRDISAPHMWRHTPHDARAEWLGTSLPRHEPVTGADVERDALHDVPCAFARALIREEVRPRSGRRERDSAGARAQAQAPGGPDLHVAAQRARVEGRKKLSIEFGAGSILPRLTRSARRPAGRAHVQYGGTTGALRNRRPFRQDRWGSFGHADFFAGRRVPSARPVSTTRVMRLSVPAFTGCAEPYEASARASVVALCRIMSR